MSAKYHFRHIVADVAADVEHSRDELLEMSRNLEDLFSRDRVRIIFDMSSVEVPETALGHLQSWMLSKSSTLLSIAAPEASYSLDSSSASQMAARVVHDADAAGIPVVSYFCELQRLGKNSNGETSQVRAVMALVYSFLRQLLEMVPINLEESETPGSQRFTDLTASLSSFDDALDLLRFALKHAPPMLYCVIAEFQVLESRMARGAIGSIIDLLKDQVRQTGRVLKVLIMTSGRSRCLLGKLSRRELVLADQDP